MSIVVSRSTIPTLQSILDERIRAAFPDGIRGVPESWADLTFMVEEFWTHPPTIEPTVPIEKEPTKKTLKNRERRKKQKLAKKAKQEAEWTEVKKSLKKTPLKKLEKPKPKTVMPIKRFKRSRDTLILKNLPYQGVTTLDLLERFEVFGDVTKINILKTDDGACKGIAFITFDDMKSATQAYNIKSFRYGGRTVYIKFA